MADTRADVARALAFFEGTSDTVLLHQLIEEVAPRAKREVGRIIARQGEDHIPPPADLRPARDPAPREEAVKTIRSTADFALLQVLTRAIGRRLEDLETVASVEFPEGSRVMVPEKNGTPAAGTVERTGTSLLVVLDSGETWEGPPSFARPGRKGVDR
jgi:hypothetical protein